MSDMTNLAGDRTSDELWRLAEDPDANREMSAIAIERAMKEDGLSLEQATRLFGFVEPPA